MSEKRGILHNVIKKVLLGIPLLFFVELILGDNGALFSVYGIFIRKILFAAAFGCLCLYCLLYARKIKIKTIDYFVLAFLIINGIYMTVIPYIQGGSISEAISDADVVSVLILYFPVVFLIRQNVIDFNRIKSTFISLAVILAVWHIVMYVLESFMPGIYYSYFNKFLPQITFGSFTRGTVIYGYGFVRIIRTTTIYLIVALFYVIGKENKKFYHYIYMFIFVFAIITTMTRSLLIASIVGLIIYMIPLNRKMIKMPVYLSKIKVTAFIIACALFINFAAIGPLSETYKNNVIEKYNRHEEIYENERIIISGEAETGNMLDRLASSTDTEDIGNKLRVDQTKALLNEWKKSPVLGFGYGHYTEECIRSKTYKYMYEATLPAMAMKLGIAGLLSWLVLAVFMALTAFRNKYMTGQYDSFITWLVSSIAFVLAIQTNPFLFTFCGMSIILFLVLDLETANVKEEI